MNNNRQTEMEISLSDIFHSIREHFWLIVGMVILGGIAAFGYLFFYTVPVYKSTASVIVNPLKGSSSIADLADGSFSNSSNIGTETGLITSKVILVNALDLLDLSKYTTPDGESYSAFYSNKDRLNGLKGKVSVSTVSSSRKVEISVQDTDMVFAADYANAIAVAYKDFLAQLAKDSKSAQRKTIELQIPENEAWLNKARATLVEFEKLHGTSQILSKVEVINPKISQIQLLRQPLLLQIEEDKKELSEQIINNVVADSNVTVLLNDYYQVAKEFLLYQNISSDGLSDRVFSLESSKGTLEQSLFNAVFALVKNQQQAKVLCDYLTCAVYVSVLDDLEASYSDEISQYQSVLVDLQELESNVSIYETIVLSLKQLLEETKVLESSVESNVILIDAAEVSKRPVSPRKAVIMLVGLLAGAAAGFAIGFIIDLSDNTIKHESGVRDILGEDAVSLGWIPYTKKLTDNSPIIVLNKSDSYAAERYRILTSNISLVKGDAKVFTVCSTDSSEGKSTCAINICTNYALLGKKVLMIDGDLRRPELENYFQIKRSKQGLSDIVMGKASKEDVILRPVEDIPNLHLLPAGCSVSNPNIVFNSKVFFDLVKQLKSVYDFIFIDCPPLSYGSDFMLLSKVLDAYLFNIRAGIATKPALYSYLDQKKSFTIPCLGYIFYGVLSAHGSYGYGYGYNYGYGYSKYGYSKYGYAQPESDSNHVVHKKLTYKVIYKKELENDFKKSNTDTFKTATVAYAQGPDKAFGDVRDLEYIKLRYSKKTKAAETKE